MRTISIGSLSRVDDGAETQTELDSHADTCVVGKNALIFQDFERPVNVTGYDAGKGTLDEGCKTISAAVAYDDPGTGEPILLVFHQAISLPSQKVNLLCPMQCRMNDVKIPEVAKFLINN